MLDVGFAQAPNEYLYFPVGLDVQHVACPGSYSAVAVANLNKDAFPFRSRSFDTVILGDVIEHVENPSFVLREAHRVLKVGGRLLVSTPHACYYWTVIDDHLLRGTIKDPDRGEHLQNWTRRDMTRLLTKNGFSLQQIHGGGCLLPILHVFIPNKGFPSSGYIIIYESKKTGKPDTRIITDTAYYGEEVIA